MTLSQRTFLVIIITFAALLFIVAFTSDLILLASYSSLENENIISHTRIISNHLHDKIKQLNISNREIIERLSADSGLPVSSAGSVSMFSDTYMRSHGIDLAVQFDRNGRITSHRVFDCVNDRQGVLSVEQSRGLSTLLTRIIADDAPVVSGVVDLAGSPFMLSVLTVRDSNGIRHGGVLTGWFIDGAEMESTFRTTGSVISVLDLKRSRETLNRRIIEAVSAGEGICSDVIDSKEIAGYLALKDLSGQPSFIVRSVEKRLLHNHGRTTISFILVSLCIVGGVFCCVMLIFIKRIILTRLQAITETVRQISEQHDISVRIPLPAHDDELKVFAVSINSMLGSLERAEERIRESEERYRLLFERAPDAIIVIGVEGDEAGRIISANQAAADQHGYTVDELCRLHIHDLNTAEANAVAGDLMDKVIAGEWATFELWHCRKDGTIFPIEVHSGLIMIGGRKYILGFDRDITERKITDETKNMHLEQISALNDELNRNALELAAANNELEAFNYSVSHDMRGPLTRISGYCQLLLDDGCVLDPEVREYISRIHESEIWLNDMIDALLHLAQITRAEITCGDVDLSAIAASVLRELTLECPGRIVRSRIEPGIIVSGDHRLLKMVMINLLNNALKYSSPRSETVIEFGAEQTGSGLVYYVRDNGVGFDMKNADKLFGVFKRLHDSSQFAGTGIGLATVQRIISRHGGRVWAEASPGSGAVFYFTLS